jgi:hypothetical protein
MRFGLLLFAISFGIVPANARANEEEQLYYQLEKEWQNLRKSRALLTEGITNLGNPEFNLELIAIRFEQIQISLAKTKPTVEQVHKGWSKLLDELIAKRARPRIIEEYSEGICKPLAQLKDSKAGELVLAEKAMENVVRLLNQNQKPETAVLQESCQRFDRLMEKIRIILLATSPPPNCSYVTQMLVEIERKQRQLAESLREQHERLIIIGPLP